MKAFCNRQDIWLRYGVQDTPEDAMYFVKFSATVTHTLQSPSNPFRRNIGPLHEFDKDFRKMWCPSYCIDQTGTAPL